jgi:hypothetical protein
MSTCLWHQKNQADLCALANATTATQRHAPETWYVFRANPLVY